MSNVSLKSIEQGRAKFAYNCVEDVVDFRDSILNTQNKEEEDFFYVFLTNKYIKKDMKKEDKEVKEKEIKKFLKANKADEGTEQIKDLNDSKNKFNKEYKSRVKKIPMLIKTNGLASTYAYIKSKDKDYPYKLIYRQTGAWLRFDPKKIVDIPEGKDLVDYFISIDSHPYRAATMEVLAFFSWLKRFADGLIEEEDLKTEKDKEKT